LRSFLLVDFDGGQMAGLHALRKLFEELLGQRVQNLDFLKPFNIVCRRL
jgi:hypothetical protein